jgi:FkbM family methyltransferase
MKEMHYDENGNVISTDIIESEEQDQANKYILPYDVVLEIGARYGTVSSVVQKRLANRSNHVAVEPDPQILPFLYRNRYLNKDEYHVFEGVISANKEKKKFVPDGYGSRIATSDDHQSTVEIDVINYQEFLKKYPLRFNVLIADCEGCFHDVLTTIGKDIDHYRLILVEEDQRHLCDYTQTHAYLLDHGFRLIKDGFHRVYIKPDRPLSYWVIILWLICLFFILFCLIRIIKKK